jgi:hypothetical protein
MVEDGGVDDGIELVEFAGQTSVLEEIEANGDDLVPYGAFVAKVKSKQMVELLGVHSWNELERSANGGLEYRESRDESFPHVLRHVDSCVRDSVGWLASEAVEKGRLLRRCDNFVCAASNAVKG